MSLGVSRRYKLLRQIEPYLFLAPALIVIGLIFAFPIVRLVTLSFQRPFQGEMLFVGLTNYQAIFKDEVFLRAVRNNLTLLISVPIMVLIALILAIFLLIAFAVGSFIAPPSSCPTSYRLPWLV